MKTSQFWYPLPERLIAQHPSERRGTEKMMVLHRATGMIEHRHIADIVEYLDEKDLLVVNDTKVFPARLIGCWEDSKGAVEVLMVAAAPESETVKELVWNVIIGSGRKCREGQVAVFGPRGELKAKLLKPLEGIGMWKVEFICERPLMDLLDEFGHTPVPPYVKREGTREEEMADRERYQTIYAREVGSVAAPTAGLHFTPELLDAIRGRGAEIVNITLHVGAGTWLPVKVEDLSQLKMHSEWGCITDAQADIINSAKRVIAVGTTSLRLLESAAIRNDNPAKYRRVAPFCTTTDIFITPGYKFRSVDVLLTNFHLPKSTLFMLVSAFAGLDEMKQAYSHAVSEKYRFFSYGDCCLLFKKGENTWQHH